MLNALLIGMNQYPTYDPDSDSYSYSNNKKKIKLAVKVKKKQLEKRTPSEKFIEKVNLTNEKFHSDPNAINLFLTALLKFKNYKDHNIKAMDANHSVYHMHKISCLPMGAIETIGRDKKLSQLLMLCIKDAFKIAVRDIDINTEDDPITVRGYLNTEIPLVIIMIYQLNIIGLFLKAINLFHTMPFKQ
jgi:hypothetical protein